MSTVFAMLTVALAMLSIAVRATESAAASNNACDGLASYQLVLQTFWSKETFYKQYPTYRPNAQWSRLIGRSHNKRYSLWSEGQVASKALKEFTEQALSTGLDVEAQGSRGIFDSFVGPIIPTGVGTGAVKFLAHSNYDKLSFVVRIVPSPDWFVGVDSLDLCTGGQWVTDKKVDLQPIDSGTDRGFTFTSPNWPEDPQKPIATITSNFPNNRASSFYYDELTTLPPIAQLHLTKINFTWVDSPEEEEQDNKTKGSSSSSAAPVLRTAVFSDGKSNTQRVSSDGGAAAAAALVLAKSLIHTELGNATNGDGGRTGETSIAKSVIRKSYSGSSRVRQLRNGRSRTPVADSADRIDCTVTDWGDWSICSKTCGFGVSIRTRSVINRSRNGGHPCPLLREQEICGSARNCNWQYFRDN